MWLKIIFGIIEILTNISNIIILVIYEKKNPGDQKIQNFWKNEEILTPVPHQSLGDIDICSSTLGIFLHLN